MTAIAVAENELESALRRATDPPGGHKSHVRRASRKEGRFGNQADQFLGALAFSKALDRTLVLPPWVEYRTGEPRSVQVPFDTYFRVETLAKYHRVLTMEHFMDRLAPTVWPPGNRTGQPEKSPSANMLI
ncbi:hypothetical protein HPB48_001624 [Haemaphysalis longicornis]|uniref:GDP-fucose protein O-fucosyltransferase 1 n=1 Tax=Haemaphysalis longicornis TaxID=44386 RepID=A0A9J6FAP5_HAELO|nr:hypothetical protein HPB48_001624 [Haemaphysalis longicornis]